MRVYDKMICPDCENEIPPDAPVSTGFCEECSKDK